MSKKQPTASKFEYTTKTAPVLKQIKTEWDLKKLFYKSATDPQIELDAKKHERLMLAFSKKYKNEEFVQSAASLKKALMDYETLSSEAGASKIIRYFSFRTTLNVNDTEAQKKLNLYSERFRKISNELLFFPLTLGQVAKNKQTEYLKNPSLGHFRYFLKKSFEAASHQLTEKEERVLGLTSNTSSGMWADATEKIIGNRKITFKGKTYALPEAIERIEQQSWDDKNILWNKILDELVSVSEFAEHELTAIVAHEKVTDELRRYKKPYSGTVRAYENNETSVENLIKVISTKGFALSQKFYQLKASLHGQKTIPYVNKYDPIGELQEPDFDTSVAICRDAFYELSTEFGQIFDRMLSHGQIDAFPKTGKRGGAFMSATIGLPTLVMLNHTNTFKSLETMAHEMGHAIHAEKSKVQTPLYEDFSTTTAETASTLFEHLVLDKVLTLLTDEQKVIFLHNKITRDIATVQRQISFFNFEFAMHEHVRAHGLITKEELANLMRKHLQSYLGKAVDVTEKDGYSYVYIPHIRYGFYVYTYTYGHLMSSLMAERFRKDKKYLDKINHFLSLGGSDTVENIFSQIGINTKTIAVFEESLKSQAYDIALLETLTKKMIKRH